VGGDSGSPRLRRQRGQSFPAFCEGLDSCRIMDYTAAIPDSHEVCRHCEAGMADDCAAEAPWDPFTRTPEPWGVGSAHSTISSVCRGQRSTR
jgi:hypothetical protein